MALPAPWRSDRVAQWQQQVGWLAGSNFTPSSAVNQLEMWQAETFDPQGIDRELGWAASLGFNSMRVFLHDLLWEDDPSGFLARVERYLQIADSHGIGTMLVLFDGVWNPKPQSGAQPEPRHRVHNAGWVQSPGAALLGDPARHDDLRSYVTGVMQHFGSDPRVHAWDLFNEPDNPNPAYLADDLSDKGAKAALLLEKAFGWAREVGPSQPLTCGVWFGDWSSPEALRPIEQLSLENSDIVTFHSYDPVEAVRERVEHLRRYQRPILCTEYMARGQKSTFDPVLGFFREQQVGAYNWGLVDGRTQTSYPWDSWALTYEGEADPWFHDIFRTDGTPYSAAEVEYIRTVTGAPAR